VRVRIPDSVGEEYYELPVVERHIHVRVNLGYALQTTFHYLLNKFVLLATLVWAAVLWVIVYVFNLEEANTKSLGGRLT